MEEDPFHHEKLADTLVKQTLAVAVGKNRLSSKFFKGVHCSIYRVRCPKEGARMTFDNNSALALIQSESSQSS